MSDRLARRKPTPTTPSAREPDETAAASATAPSARPPRQTLTPPLCGRERSASAGGSHAGTGASASARSTASSPRRPDSPRLRRDDHTVREDSGGDRLHVLGNDVVAAERHRTRLGHPEERDSGARARPEGEHRAVARVPEERDDVRADALLDVDRPRGRRSHRRDRRGRRPRASRSSGGAVVCSASMRRLLAERRIAEREPRGEAVELGLGQRIRPLVLDRVLGGDDEERLLDAGSSRRRSSPASPASPRAARTASSATRG